MEQTERLYFTDSRLLEFPATIVEIIPTELGHKVVLDRTAFYPTGGGQPNDTGKLDGAQVIDVIEEAGRIFHLLDDASGFRTGKVVQGLVDLRRRVDHLQQHSGQHILSQAFVQACGAQTRSFHLGTQTSTIDIELASPTSEQMRAAEEIANEVIFEDRPMRVHLLNEEEAARLPLRKESAVQGSIRVIEIENFDWSPCGGTHASRAGEVGLVAIRSHERAKKMTRIEFVCGWRALADYRAANATAVAVARSFSADRDTAPELVERALKENKSLKKRLRELLELAMTAEASRMLKEATPTGEFKLVRGVFEDRDMDELRVLASKIVEQEPAVALLGAKDDTAARLVFARSVSGDHDMGRLLAGACQVLGGRGGGKPELAQGGGPDRHRLDEAIAGAVKEISNCEFRIANLKKEEE
jgi:alanyl-tRNA synthetase